MNPDEIDWKYLGEPEIPQWLKDLTSNDRETRRAAYEKMVDRLIPWPAFDERNGDIKLFKYALRDDIPLLIVPFLIEFLTTENLRNKDGILGMLHNLACYIYVSVAQDEPEDSIYRTRARLIREAVRRGTRVYRSFLDLPDSEYYGEEMELKRGAEVLLRILQSENLDEL